MLEHFGPVVGANELLLLVGWVIIFGIIANHQSKVYDESRLSHGLKGTVTNYFRL